MQYVASILHILVEERQKVLQVLKQAEQDDIAKRLIDCYKIRRCHETIQWKELPETIETSFLHYCIELQLKLIDRKISEINLVERMKKEIRNSSNLENNIYLDFLYFIIKGLELEFQIIIERRIDAGRKLKVIIQDFKTKFDVGDIIDMKSELDENSFFLRFLLNQILRVLFLFGEYDVNRIQLIEKLQYLEVEFQDEQNYQDLISIKRNLGIQYHMDSKIELAKQQFLEALEIAQKLEDTTEVFGLLNNLGVISRILGIYDDSIEFYQSALNLSISNSGLKSFQGMIMNNIGVIYFYKNDLKRATEFYQRAYETFPKDEQSKVKASTLDNIGEIYYLQASFEQALQFYQMALRIREELNIQEDIATSLENIGNILRDQGKLLSARNNYERSLEIRVNIGKPLLLANSYRYLSTIEMQMGQYNQAVAYEEDLLKIWEDVGNKIEIVKTIFELILLCYDKFNRENMNGNNASKFLKTFKSHIERNEKIYKQLKRDKEEIPREIDHIIEIQQVLEFAVAKRQSMKFKAIDRIRVLLPKLDYDFNLYYRMVLLLMKLLLFELQTFYEEDVKVEIWEILTELKRKAKISNSLPKVYQIGLLEAELHLLDLEIEVAEKLLVSLSVNTEESGLYSLNQQVNHFYLEFLDKKNELMLLQQINPDLKEILKNSTIGSTVDKLTYGIEGIELQDLKYQPKVVLIINIEKGINIHAKRLDKTFLMNESLISALISAISSFMKEAFHSDGGLHRIDYGENFALFTQEQSILFCHLLSGSAEYGLSKLLEFKNQVLKIPELWKLIREFHSEVPRTIETQLDNIIDNIF